jgi:hypothetical protein
MSEEARNVTEILWMLAGAAIQDALLVVVIGIFAYYPWQGG